MSVSDILENESSFARTAKLGQLQKGINDWIDSVRGEVLLGDGIKTARDSSEKRIEVLKATHSSGLTDLPEGLSIKNVTIIGRHTGGIRGDERFRVTVDSSFSGEQRRNLFTRMDGLLAGLTTEHPHSRTSVTYSIKPKNPMYTFLEACAENGAMVARIR